MLFTLFLYVIGYLIGLIVSALSLLGTATLPATMSSAVVACMVYLANLDYFVPTATMVLALGVVMVAEFAWLAYQFIRWTYQKIPTVN
jgi:hypothetical protein